MLRSTVRKREVSKVNLFGNEVVLYKFSYAGFLCEADEQDKENSYVTTEP